MTLVEVAAILAAIVAGAVYAIWTVRVHTIKCGRLIQLHRERILADIESRGDDQSSREAWVAHLVATRVRHEALDDALAARAGVERLVGLLTSIEVVDYSQIEVVA